MFSSVMSSMMSFKLSSLNSSISYHNILLFMLYSVLQSILSFLLSSILSLMLSSVLSSMLFSILSLMLSFMLSSMSFYQRQIIKEKKIDWNDKLAKRSKSVLLLNWISSDEYEAVWAHINTCYWGVGVKGHRILYL